MKIQLNGESRELDGETTVLQLLESLGLQGKPVVVELNKTALFPREHATVVLQENDVVEVVEIAAGG